MCLLLVAPFVVLACGGSVEQASEAARPVAAPGHAPQLAVARIVTGNPPRRDIVLVTADGTGARALTGRLFPPNFFDRGTWSPDARRFAYGGVVRSGFRDEPSDIFVVDVNASKTERLTTTGRACCPVWSPDGRTIVFAELGQEAAGPRRTATIWAMDGDGGNKRRLLDPVPDRIDIPSSFSPDGSQLAFTRAVRTEPGEGGRVENTRAVRLLDLRRLEERRLVERAADPAFSPDGRRIAYVTDRDENGELSYGGRVFAANELYVLDVQGGETRRLTRTRNLNEAAPSWSPDGALIAYQQGRVTGNAEAMSVLTIHADGSCPRRIAHDPGLGVWYRGPVWRPGLPTGDAHRLCSPARSSATPLVPLAGNMSLQEARRFRPLRVYWVGRRFEAFILSSISRHRSSGPRGRGPVVSLIYGGFDIQLWPACVRVPADSGAAPGPRSGVRIRGVDGLFFEGGYRLELVTGKTTIVLFGERRRLLRVARALRPVGASKPARRLPPPAPGALSGRLRC